MVNPVKEADVVVVDDGVAVVPFNVYVKLVAPVPDCHEIKKVVAVIDDDVMIGAMGAVNNVVTGSVFDTVEPPLLLAVVMTLYRVFIVRPVKVADVVVVDVGVVVLPFSVYV